MAYAAQQIEEERLALRQRKWKVVSEYIQRHEPLALYSGEACREHYETITAQSWGASGSNSQSRDPKMAKLRSERLQQTALLEHFKRAECL